MRIAKPKEYPYHSVFANIFKEYIEINRAVGKNFEADASAVWRFDKWCVENGVTGEVLTQDVYSRWCEVAPHVITLQFKKTILMNAAYIGRSIYI